MISKAWPIVFLLVSSAWAFDKDFKIESDRVPTEFALMFDSMKLEIKTAKEKIHMVGLVKDLDENLGTFEKEHLYMLLKSEVIKDVLEYRFEKVRQFDVTVLLMERLEIDFKKKEPLLNPFAKWIWRSILAELKYRHGMGLITNQSFNPLTFNGAKLAEAQRFERYLHYMLPWIDRMDSLTAPEFNSLTKEVSWVVLRRINDRSLLFKRYASTTSNQPKSKLFNIPQRLLEINPEDLKKIQNSEAEPTLSEKSKKEKTEAEAIVDKVTPDDMSSVSDDVIKAVDETIAPAMKKP